LQIVNDAVSRFDPSPALIAIKGATLVAFGWILGCILVGVVAWRTEFPPGPLVAALSLAIGPALITLALGPRAGEGWAQAFIIFAWLGFAGAVTGASGGFHSPLAAAFTLAPAFALRFGGRARAAEAAFFAALAFALAGALAAPGAPPDLGLAPAMGAGLSLLASGVLIAGGEGTPRERAPARPATRAALSAGGDRAFAREAGAATVSRLPAAQSGAAQSSAPQSSAPQSSAPQSSAARSSAAQPSAAETLASQTIAAQRRRAAELAHEFRTPLNHILGFADAMRQRLFGPMHERYGEYAELIHTSGRHLLDLVNGLLDLTRLEAGRYPLELEDFDFRFGAEEVIQLARDSARAKAIALAIDADEELPVRADARALRQILTNLVANAIKFTPEGGVVTARARLVGDNLVLEVQDNGPGIAPGERARLGAPFERGAAAAQAEGAGLGLALVRGFAAALGGGLGFDAAPGGGALVRVTMPVARR
jgi:cell cycle sensor histidine kinase DivJ